MREQFSTRIGTESGMDCGPQAKKAPVTLFREKEAAGCPGGLLMSRPLAVLFLRDADLAARGLDLDWDRALTDPPLEPAAPLLHSGDREAAGHGAAHRAQVEGGVEALEGIHLHRSGHRTHGNRPALFDRVDRPLHRS